MYQMSCSYHHDGGMKSDAIAYGGNKRRQSKFDKHVMTDLRILRFGRHKVISTTNYLCVSVCVQMMPPKDAAVVTLHFVYTVATAGPAPSSSWNIL